MSQLIKSRDALEIGGFINKWFERRLARNQNAIVIITGSTGSSKSWDCLSAGESWYNYKFHKPFPKENICFSLGLLARRVKELEKTGTKGQIVILEEAGANFGNLDFQNKLSKMFSYILQSFRSLNVILLMNAPVLTMINKNARLLLHANFITQSIDYENKIAKVKPLFHQLNQQTGKSYWKYPRVRINGKIITLQRLKFNVPSEELVKDYEEMKYTFVTKLTDDFIEETAKADRDSILKMTRKGLTPTEYDVFEMLNKGLDVKQMAQEKGLDVSTIYYHLRCIYLKGYDTKAFLQNIRNSKSLTTDTVTPIT